MVHRLTEVLRRIKRAAFQRTYESVLLSIDLTTNLSLPQAELDRQELDFGCVRFHELCSQTLTLTNIGLNDFQFKFLREGIGAFPSWLTVNPSCDWVKQGEYIYIYIYIYSILVKHPPELQIFPIISKFL
ncbi:unnamed protein product [Trichobilharzia regenti]|nr:unnamed protein product [Trichobilharzia regenti]